MLRDGLEDIPRRYPDMDFGLIHTGWHDLIAHGGHDDGPDGFGANGTIFGRHGIQSRDLASPRMRFLESDPAGQSRPVHRSMGASLHCRESLADGEH